MLDAIETHCSETCCLSAWICPSVSASLRGSVSLGFFLAGFFFTVCFFVGRRDFFRAIVSSLFQPYSNSSVTGTPRALARRFSTSRDGFFFFPAYYSANYLRCICA